MTSEQVEEKVIDLIHRKPFVPFVVEMTDGECLDVPHPRLSINGGGALFFGPDGGLVDFEFKLVRSIREVHTEIMARKMFLKKFGMPNELPRSLLEENYDEAAQEYLSKLPPEHFMKARSQASQREITLESLSWVHEQRPDIQYFSELLVQYPLLQENKLGQVVPDNMVVIHPKPIIAEGSYNIPLQPVAPYWVLEYVSKGSRRKDYIDNKRRYESELKVPYYLLFEPHKQELQLYQMSDDRYQVVSANDEGRLALPELEIEVALLDDWVRFWFRGDMVPLPGEMQRSLDEAKNTARAEKRRADTASRRAKAAERRAEESDRRADEERHRTDEERRRADEERRRADEERRRADEADRRVEAERQGRLERDEEIARLRAMLERRGTSADEWAEGQNET